MSFFAHFALTIAANGGSGWITVSVCVVGFLMSIDPPDREKCDRPSYF
ncbi:hypothetical protein [Microcoleus sp. Pol12A6]